MCSVRLWFRRGTTIASSPRLPEPLHPADALHRVLTLACLSLECPEALLYAVDRAQAHLLAATSGERAELFGTLAWPVGTGNRGL